MTGEISLLIKAFERPEALERLLGSILGSPAAGSRILIADDSRRPFASDLLARENIAYHQLPYDSGLAYGRNFLLDRVATPYSVLLDDDFIFTPQTRLEVLLGIVKHKGFDLAAGAVENLNPGNPGFANIEVAGGNLTIRPGAPPRETLNGLPRYDMVNNFFLAKTDTLRDIRWDDRFKIYGEHTDFFYRYSARYRATFAGEVVVGHGTGGYSARGMLGKNWPGRGYRSLRILGRKHGVERFGGKRIFGVAGLFNFYLPGMKSMLGRALQFVAARLRGTGGA